LIRPTWSRTVRPASETYTGLTHDPGLVRGVERNRLALDDVIAFRYRRERIWLAFLQTRVSAGRLRHHAAYWCGWYRKLAATYMRWLYVAFPADCFGSMCCVHLPALCGERREDIGCWRNYFQIRAEFSADQQRITRKLRLAPAMCVNSDM
jgi:hypothetical protein